MELSFRLMDMSGRLVHQGVARYSGSDYAYALPDLSHLPDGIYTLETGTSTLNKAVFKLIKQ